MRTLRLDEITMIENAEKAIKGFKHSLELNQDDKYNCKKAIIEAEQFIKKLTNEA